MARHKLIVLLAGVVIVAGAIAGLFILHSRPKLTGNELPANIKSQLAFKAYAPAGDYYIVRGSIKYDSQQQLLSINVGSQGKPIVALTEQPYPDTLIYDKLIGTMAAVREVGNSLGKATVTHPKATPDKEVVAVQADTTLLFASSDVRQNDADWRALLNSLQEVH